MEKSYLFRLLYQLVKCNRYYSLNRPSYELPRITVPQKMIRHIEKAKEKQALLSHQKKRSPKYKSPVVISCKRDEYNHHQGQTYSGFNPTNLASHGWKNKASADDHFTILPHAENPAVLSCEEMFTDFNLHEGLQMGIKNLGFTQPTLIQRLAIPKILDNNNIICAAETGSGKTLAYLLPALQHIHEQKAKQNHSQPGHSQPGNSPRTLILTPSRELADQIVDVCKRFTAYADFKAHGLCGGRGTKQRLAWSKDIMMDVLVSTPGVLRKFVSSGLINPRSLQHVILDEADSLLDDSFSSEVDYVLNKLQVSGGRDGGTLFTLVSATMPRGLDQMTDFSIPVDSLERVSTDHLHRLMPHVPQTFMRLKPSQKGESVIQLVHKSIQQGVPTLIFCNKSSTCFWLSELLQENNIPNSLINGLMQEKKRSYRYNKFQSGQTDVMVATDIASRGLDLLRVGHVINFDFPLFMSDYIHRAGRVGRVGSQGTGKVSSFVVKKWDVDLLWQIETAARRQEALYNVNANIKRKIDGIVARKFPQSQLH